MRAVLWDADGVLQVLPPFDELWTFLPAAVREAVLADTFGSDMPDVLTGAVDMSSRVDGVVERHRLGEHRATLRETWNHFPPVRESRELLAAVRRAGMTCVLATNQDTLREANMRAVYEPLLDRLYFSSSIGLAKPDPAFFGHIADDLGLPPADMLFIDDSAGNVEGARAAGLHAELWHHQEGVEVLRAALERHGVSG